MIVADPQNSFLPNSQVMKIIQEMHTPFKTTSKEAERDRLTEDFVDKNEISEVINSNNEDYTNAEMINTALLP